MNEHNQITYENRLVAFIDILGFSKLIDRSVAEPGIVPWMVNVLDAIKSNEGLKEKFGKKLDVRIEFTAFSDCFVLSTRIPEDPVNTALYQVALICSLMLRAGVFVRGAIVEGMLFHRDNIVFGPGLLDAYNKEQKECVFPRIILSNDLVQRYEQEIQVPELGQYTKRWSPFLIRKDKDFFWYLDTIFTVPFSLENADEAEHLKLVKIEIEKKINLHEHDPKIFKKYVWVKDYFNSLVEEHPEYDIKRIGDIYR